MVGRAYADPGKMKPNPEPLLLAAAELGVLPQSCVLGEMSLERHMDAAMWHNHNRRTQQAITARL